MGRIQEDGIFADGANGFVDSPFWNHYAPVNEIKKGKPASFRDFVLHDLLTFVTSIYGFSASTDMQRLQSLLARSDSTVADILPEIERISKEPFQISDDFPAYIRSEKHIQEEAFRGILPILISSAMFLDEPSEKRYEELAGQETTLNVLAAALHETSASDMSLNGPEAIIALNLIKNARSHGIKGIPISIRSNERGFAVQNRSPLPLPPQEVLYTFGGKSGATGNTGMGLFTAHALYAPLLGGELVNHSLPLPGGTFDIYMAYARPKVIAK